MATRTSNRPKERASTIQRALGDSKTQMIRSAFEDLGPEARPVDVAARLQAKGVQVSLSQVSRVKKTMAPERPGSPGGDTPPRAGIIARPRKSTAEAEAAGPSESKRQRNTAKAVRRGFRVPHA